MSMYGKICEPQSWVFARILPEGTTYHRRFPDGSEQPISRDEYMREGTGGDG